MPTQSPSYRAKSNSQPPTALGGCTTGHHLGEERHFVDPWDLENYAYLRRHSIALPASHRSSRLDQFTRQLTSSSSSLSSLSSQSRRTSIYDCLPHSYGQWRQRRQAQYLIDSYRCIPWKGDWADKLNDCDDVDELSETAAVATSAEQIVRQHHGHCHHCRLYHTRRDGVLSIYDDETIEANGESLPIHYAPTPELQPDESFQKNGEFDREEREYGTGCAIECGATKNVMGNRDALSRKCHTYAYVYEYLSEIRATVRPESDKTLRSKNGDIFGKFAASRVLRRPLDTSNGLQTRYSSNIAVSENERMDIYLTKANTLPFLQPLQRSDLNTRGQLKIDYTDSWNSLNRKINK